jgi:hypothetical protein
MRKAALMIGKLDHWCRAHNCEIFAFVLAGPDLFMWIGCAVMARRPDCVVRCNAVKARVSLSEAQPTLDEIGRIFLARGIERRDRIGP